MTTSTVADRSSGYGSTAESAYVQGVMSSPGQRRAVALAGLLVAAACVATLGLLVPAPDELEVERGSTHGTRLSSSALSINWRSHPGMASKLASADSDAWLHTSDFQLTALPEYDPDDDSDDQDKLAQANLDDEELPTMSTLSSLPRETKALDVKPKKKYQNPDVAGLNALRNKVFQEDHPTQETESERENKIFAKAAQEEAALKNSVHREAAAKKQKHAIAKTKGEDKKTIAQVKKTAAQAMNMMDRPQVRVRKEESAQVVVSYEKGSVREDKQQLSVLKERESLEQAMIDTETRKKKASLAHINSVEQQITRLESQKEHAQHEKLERHKEVAQHAAERAQQLMSAQQQAKKRDKTMQSLELEMAAIKRAENARLAALSAKIKSLGGEGDSSGDVEQAHTPQEKAAVQVLSAPNYQELVAKPVVASGLAHAAPIEEARSKQAQIEKTTDGILAPKSAGKLAVHIDEPKHPVFSDAAREERLLRCICVCVCVSGFVRCVYLLVWCVLVYGCAQNRWARGGRVAERGTDVRMAVHKVHRDAEVRVPSESLSRSIFPQILSCVRLCASVRARCAFTRLCVA